MGTSGLCAHTTQGCADTGMEHTFHKGQQFKSKSSKDPQKVTSGAKQDTEQRILQEMGAEHATAKHPGISGEKG